MSIPSNEATKPESCGASLEEHFTGIFFAMLAAGIGFRCPEVYKALAEFTEAVRAAGNHERHEPTAEGIGASLALALAEQARGVARGPADLAFRARLQHAAEALVERYSAREDTVPSEPDVRRDYGKLSPEDKKRFN